jgi:hypothetical protein
MNIYINFNTLSFFSAHQLKKKEVKTQKIWERRFPREPYFLELTSQLADGDQPAAPSFFSNFSYDIMAASKRQESFFYQVILVFIHGEQGNGSGGQKSPHCYFLFNS